VTVWLSFPQSPKLPSLHRYILAGSANPAEAAEPRLEPLIRTALSLLCSCIFSHDMSFVRCASLFVRRLDLFSFDRIHGTHSLLCEVFLKIGVERKFDIENRAWDSVPVVDKSP
jgi:hypothetical protein